MLTFIMLHCVKDYEINIHILDRILDFAWSKLMILTPNSNTCHLSYTANNMPAVAIATLGTRPSAGMALTPKPFFFLYRQKIRESYNEPYPVGGLINKCAPIIQAEWSLLRIPYGRKFDKYPSKSSLTLSRAMAEGPTPMYWHNV